MNIKLGQVCEHGNLARQCELCDNAAEILDLRAQLERKSEAIQLLWRERDQLRAAAIAARRALSELLMSRDPVVYSDALRMLDEALGG